MKSYIRVQICHWVFYCPLHKLVENGVTLLIITAKVIINNLKYVPSSLVDPNYHYQG